ncbi:MAG: ZPR1 zinc finger domain-containing protein [Saccharolobus sp.]
MDNQPTIIFEETIVCPVCKKNSLKARDYLYEAPNAGKLVLSNWTCEECGYRFRDVKPYESKEPKKIILEINSEEDLKTIIYRSAFAKIVIPELDVEIEPAGASQGYITTIEGIFEILLDQLGSNCNDECTKMIRSAMEVKTPYTIILEDESGLSFIKSEKAKIVYLDQKT